MKHKKIYQKLGLKIKKIDEEESSITGVFSTEQEDRHGDIVFQNWDLKNFKKNPVVLNSHKYDDAVEVVGRVEKIRVKDKQLLGKVVFATKENPKAKIIYDLYKSGFLKAFSVGFMPKEIDNKERILKSELLELSVVGVGANATSLAKKIKSLVESNAKNKEKTDNGFNKWEETAEEIYFRHKEIGEFEFDSLFKEFIRKRIPRIKVISGILKKEKTRAIQMFIFKKKDGWSISSSKKWLNQKEYDFASKTAKTKAVDFSNVLLRYEKIDNNKNNYTKEEKIKMALSNLSNQHIENRKNALKTIYNVLHKIETKTFTAKEADESLKVDLKCIVNRTLRKLQKLKL